MVQRAQLARYSEHSEPEDFLLGRLVERSAQGVLVHRYLRPLYANGACARLFGYGTGADLCSDDRLATLFEHTPLMEEKSAALLESRDLSLSDHFLADCRRSDGSQVWIEVILQPIQWSGGMAIQCSFSDATERWRRERWSRQFHLELVDSARQAAMREISDALLHRLNQPCGAMLNYASALKRLHERDAQAGPIMRVAEQLAREAERASAIIGDLNVLAAPGERILHDVRDVVAEAVRALEAEAVERKAEIHVEVAGDLPKAMMIKRQIQQVIMGLIRRIIESVDAGAACRVVVRAEKSGPGIRFDVAADFLDPEIVSALRERRPAVGLCEAIIESHGGWMEPVTSCNSRLVSSFVLPSGIRDA